MKFPDRITVEKIRGEYPKGCRIVIDRMEDPQAPEIGTQGTVTGVDDTASICPVWDTGSHLNIVFGEDACHKIRTEEEAKVTLLHYAAAQHDGARCPRCGKEMQGKLYTHALSRRVDIIICDECGVAEALEDAGLAKPKKKLMEWTAVTEPQEGGGAWPQ